MYALLVAKNADDIAIFSMILQRAGLQNHRALCFPGDLRVRCFQQAQDVVVSLHVGSL